MIHNHIGKAVWDYHYTDNPISLCPICEGPLTGKRYAKRVIWHWAHRPKHRGDCPHYESHWHLVTKIAQSRLPGWVIEHPIQTTKKKYRVDAYNTKHRRIREFVHTVTPYYYQKHLVLRAEHYSQVNWVYHGEQYVSLRARPVAKGGIKSFLVPRAWELFEKIGGLVHYNQRLWKHWQKNIWFPFDDPDATRFLDSFAAVEHELETTTLNEILRAAKGHPPTSKQPAQPGASSEPPPSSDQSTNDNPQP